jgi:ankyrin repeat protein
MHLLKYKKITILDYKQNIKDFLNEQDKYGNNPLMLACIYKDKSSTLTRDNKLKCVRMLLQNGCDPNVVNKHSGFTPMHWLARYGELSIIKEIYKKRPDVCEYLPDFRGFTPLDYAGMFEHNETVNFLINKIMKKIHK